MIPDATSIPVILTLPVEIILSITEYLPRRTNKRTSYFSNFAISCRHTYELLSPRIYSAIKIKNNYSSFFDLVTTNEDFGHKFKSCNRKLAVNFEQTVAEKFKLFPVDSLEDLDVDFGFNSTTYEMKTIQTLLYSTNYDLLTKLSLSNLPLSDTTLSLASKILFKTTLLETLDLHFSSIIKRYVEKDWPMLARGLIGLEYLKRFLIRVHAKVIVPLESVFDVLVEARRLEEFDVMCHMVTEPTILSLKSFLLVHHVCKITLYIPKFPDIVNEIQSRQFNSVTIGASRFHEFQLVDLFSSATPLPKELFIDFEFRYDDTRYTFLVETGGLEHFQLRSVVFRSRNSLFVHILSGMKNSESLRSLSCLIADDDTIYALKQVVENCRTLCTLIVSINISLVTHEAIGDLLGAIKNATNITAFETFDLGSKVDEMFHRWLATETHLTSLTLRYQNPVHYELSPVLKSIFRNSMSKIKTVLFVHSRSLYSAGQVALKVLIEDSSFKLIAMQYASRMPFLDAAGKLRDGLLMGRIVVDDLSDEHFASLVDGMEKAGLRFQITVIDGEQCLVPEMFV
ncbi:hypothetical protein HK098_006327 [Nowakowskiella sp. JEL0407]|nr:hypothetical protein HK098_006327 [Nowakowskiella sp. JEL0407]